MLGLSFAVPPSTAIPLRSRCVCVPLHKTNSTHQWALPNPPTVAEPELAHRHGSANSPGTEREHRQPPGASNNSSHSTQMQSQCRLPPLPITHIPRYAPRPSLPPVLIAALAGRRPLAATEAEPGPPSRPGRKPEADSLRHWAQINGGRGGAQAFPIRPDAPTW